MKNPKKTGHHGRKSTASNVRLVCDLKGKPITGGAIAAAASKDGLDGLIEKADFLEMLEDRVKENGLPGSKLVKAFSLFTALGDCDLSSDEVVARLRTAVDDAWREWCGLSDGEKRHILGGWNPREPAGVAELVRDMAGHSDNMSAWMLTANAHAGKVNFFAENQLIHNTAAVQVAIRQGTSKAQGLAELRDNLAAFEAYWDSAICLNGKEGLTVEAESSKPLAVGTFVSDPGCNDFGIVVGGYKGTNGYLYTYLNGAGQVNSQYAGGLKVAPEVRGGMPKVSDLGGADPLAGRRMAAV